jgi:uncharacterized protein YcgI (DUF1989 family)
MRGTTKAAFCWLARALSQCGREAIAAAYTIAAGAAIILAIATLAIVARGATAFTIAAGSATAFTIAAGTASTFTIAAGTTIILAISTGAALRFFTALTGAAISSLLPTRGIA